MKYVLGYYNTDGSLERLMTVYTKEKADKIYLVNHFTRKNGSKDSKATSICKIEEAKRLGEILATL